MGNTTTARDLRAAADYIDKHGWVRGELEDDAGGVCLVGALGKIIEGRVSYGVCTTPRYLSVEAVMAPTIARATAKYRHGSCLDTLDAFNDICCEKPEDVTTALRRVANELDPPKMIPPEMGLTGPGKEIFVEPKETPAPNVTPLPQKAPVAPVPEKVPA